jgi:hypothetical protein
MNCLNTTIVVSRFNENIFFLKKIPIKIIIYEKEKPDYKYNIEKNKGNEASVYLKYVIDHYDSLNEYTIFIHCHEFSWHHKGSIVDIIRNQLYKHHTFTNLNNVFLKNVENTDISSTPFGMFCRKFIRPAVGPYVITPNFHDNVLGCAQFIVHKNNILNHSKIFYQRMYHWLMVTHITNYWNGRFLEWTWDLFWNKCLQHIPIRKYLNEEIVTIQFGNSYEIMENKKNEIIQSLQEKQYYYVDNELKVITNLNEYTCKQQYIYNKYI